MSTTIATLLSERATDSVRAAGWDDLVERAVLHAANPAGATEQGIASEVKRQFGIAPHPRVLNAAIKRLSDSGTFLVEDNGKRYLLSADAERRLRAGLASSDELRQTVWQEWEERLRATYPDLTDAEISHLREDLREYVGTVMGYCAIESAWFFTEKQSPAPQMPSPGDTIASALSGRPKHLVAIAEAAFPSFFREATGPRLRYIRDLFEANLCLELMNATPPAGDVIQPELQHLTLYLDTNTVLNLLGFDGDEDRQLAEEGVRLAASVGGRVLLSARTVRELLDKLDNADKIYRRSGLRGRPSQDQAQLAVDSNIDEAFIAGFFRQVAAGSEESWSQFVSRHRQIGAVLSRVGVLGIDDESCVGLGEHPQLGRLMELVGKKASHKSPSVREHDALHYLLVRRHRQQAAGRWPTCWFVTRDRSLPSFDADARKEEAAAGAPFCMLLEALAPWLDLLAPVALVGDTPTRVYGRLLCDLHFARYVQGSRAEVALRLVGLREVWKDLSPEIVFTVGTDVLLSQQLDQLHDTGADTPEARDDLIVEALGRIADTMHRGATAELEAKALAFRELRRRWNEQRASLERQKADWRKQKAHYERRLETESKRSTGIEAQRKVEHGRYRRLLWVSAAVGVAAVAAAGAALWYALGPGWAWFWLAASPLAAASFTLVRRLGNRWPWLLLPAYLVTRLVLQVTHIGSETQAWIDGSVSVLGLSVGILALLVAIPLRRSEESSARL